MSEACMPCCARLKKWGKRLLLALLVLMAVMAVAGFISHLYRFWDDDADRGAIPMTEKDKFGESFSKVVYLDGQENGQGWKAAQSLWFYNVSQGSDLLPYDFFLALEQKDSQTLVRDNANINNFRYLPQKATFSNPDGLPLGFVADSYRGKKYMGFTCAACHTGQVNYKGTAIRVDGAPAGADMERFIAAIGDALKATREDKAKRERFVKAVLAKGSYRDEKEVLADLDVYVARIGSYVLINQPQTPYHYGRLDAFGRIYNRVLEHVMNPQQLRDVFDGVLTKEEQDKILGDLKGDMISTAERDQIYERMAKLLTQEKKEALRNRMFNRADAPVSYPFIWDVPQHDYVQWNGLAANAGVGPLGRNAGEVIGVFGTLDWQKQPGWTLSSALGGQGWFTSSHIDYTSSVKVNNLRLIEHQLASLKSPKWPEEILGKLDAKKVDQGEVLFDQYCRSCHQEIDRSAKDRRIVASMNKVEALGTDAKMVNNSVSYGGYSGILRNQYVDTGVGNILIQEKAPVAALLTKADQNVLVTPDPDKWLIRSFLERVYDFVVTFRDNEIKPSIKQGDYVPDTTANPFASLRSYKGRALNGIWATAPYLHNGSVPTLYDLLLPAKGECQSDAYRPDTFKVGAREYDVVKGGFVTNVGDDFNTAEINNSNHGHNYGGCERKLADGTLQKALTKEQREAIVEYMKSL